MTAASSLATDILDDRIIPLEGAMNVRDGGGYRAAGGKTIKWGKIIRSGTVQTLSKGDLAYLADLSIATVFDFRTVHECISHPNAYRGLKSVSIENCSYEPVVSSAELVDTRSADEARSAKIEYLYRLAEQLRPGIVRLCARMASDDRPLLIHSANGKQRCGIVLAVIHAVLGVDRETIVEDYALSTDAFPIAKEEGRLFASYDDPVAQQGALLFRYMNPEIREVILGTDRRVISGVLDAMERDFGSIENYIAVGYKGADGFFAGMRENFLERAQA